MIAWALYTSHMEAQQVAKHVTATATRQYSPSRLQRDTALRCVMLHNHRNSLTCVLGARLVVALLRSRSFQRTVMIPLVLVTLHITPGLHLWWIPRCKSEDEATQLPHMFERSSHCLARAAETASISNNASVFRPSSLLATRTWVLAFVILQLCFTLVPSFSGSPPPRQRNPFHFVLADSSVHDDPRIAITCHEPLPDLDQFSRYPLRPCVGSCTQKPVIVALTLAATLTVSVSESLIFMSTPPPPPPPPPPQPPTRPAAGAAAAAVAAAAVAPSATPATAKSVLPDL